MREGAFLRVKNEAEQRFFTFISKDDFFKFMQRTLINIKNKFSLSLYSDKSLVKLRVYVLLVLSNLIRVCSLLLKICSLQTIFATTIHISHPWLGV